MIFVSSIVLNTQTLKWSLSILASWLMMGLPSWAFQLLPMSQEFAPSGSQATQSYQIKNTKTKAIAVELSMVQRSVDADGNEIRNQVSDDFILYPSQIILEPDQQQTVRVTWVGDEAPAQELSYRLLAEELPLKLESATEPSTNAGKIEAKIDVLFSYAASVYVRPAQARPDVVLQAVQPVQLSDGQPGLEIYLKNQGTSRQTLKVPQIRLSAQGQSILLEGDVLETINRRTILANGERRFQIPWPVGLPQGDVSGELLVN
jgi:fimbrial chaperone protein